MTLATIKVHNDALKVSTVRLFIVSFKAEDRCCCELCDLLKQDQNSQFLRIQIFLWSLLLVNSGTYVPAGQRRF